MSIYDKGLKFDYKLTYEKVKRPLIALAGIIVVAIVVLIIFSIISLFQPRVIELEFEKNPIKASEQTYLITTITNITDNDASGVLVEVRARDAASISVSPPSSTIALLESGKGKRILKFLTNPVGAIPPGNYVIDVSVTMNGQIYREEAVLIITQ